MQSELIMIDPNELEIDLPVDPINVEVKKRSIQENGFGQSVTIWLYNGRIIDGFHRVVGAKEVGLKSIPCQVIDCDEDAFWDQRIQSARQHHQVEDDRLIVWMFESWKLTPWYKGEVESNGQEVSDVPMSTIEKLLAQLVRRNKRKPTQVKRVNTGGDPLADMVKPLFEVVFAKYIAWNNYGDQRAVEKLSPEVRELVLWMRQKAALWGVEPYDLVKRVLLWAKVGKNGHIEAKHYGLSFEQAQELEKQTEGKIVSQSKYPKRSNVREVVDAWVEDELKTTVGPVKSLYKFAEEYRAKQERQKQVETLRVNERDRTPTGQAQLAKQRVEARTEALKGVLLRSYDNLLSVINDKFPEAPILLAQHIESICGLIREVYPNSEVASEVNPIWLENIRLRKQVAEQAAEIASLKRALGSKVNVSESFKAARALSSIEIEAQP